MSRKNGVSLFYYQHDHMHSSVGVESWKVLRGGIPIAEISSRGSGQMSCLKVERSNTVIGLAGNKSSLKGYTAYGFMQAGPEAPVLGFNGQRMDSGTEAYPLGNGLRLYSPRIGRFYNPDMLSPFGEGGINHYAYCVGDPVNYQDPSGKARMMSAPTRTYLNHVKRRADSSRGAASNEMEMAVQHPTSVRNRVTYDLPENDIFNINVFDEDSSSVFSAGVSRSISDSAVQTALATPPRPRFDHLDITTVLDRLVPVGTGQQSGLQQYGLWHPPVTRFSFGSGRAVASQSFSSSNASEPGRARRILRWINQHPKTTLSLSIAAVNLISFMSLMIVRARK
ncbi:RHS repeat-associated core domain-containing protein [Pseudomonas sp. Teo4]|uniref:RHS repeat-associated core domain-containing protein n=1 Tax=Pseudomonas sp. Teo4 TaxID=3064528 RepID=UPI002ABA1450|nr:RHS repeat-associated core domain-containing protein [Pseudomonas sp. Teo4]MDZ3991793.1 hypothetical protein [Pseudomonas sp. Teo4]